MATQKAIKMAIVEIAKEGDKKPIPWSREYFEKLKLQFPDLFDGIIRAFIVVLEEEDTTFKYRCEFTEPTSDGTGLINWDMWGVDPNGFYIPGYHATFQTPYLETDQALNAANPVQAIKALLNTFMPAGWDEETMYQVQADNYNSILVQDELDAMVETYGGYPFDISLEPIPTP